MEQKFEHPDYVIFALNRMENALARFEAKTGNSEYEEERNKVLKYLYRCRVRTYRSSNIGLSERLLGTSMHAFIQRYVDAILGIDDAGCPVESTLCMTDEDIADFAVLIKTLGTQLSVIREEEKEPNN